jgi:flavin-dependent dehydrogenase
VADVTSLGEMHIRSGWYLGLAPVTDTIANVCVVLPRPRSGATPQDHIREGIRRLPAVAARCERATFDGEVRVLGPLASRVTRPGVPGLLLAGDAGGFIDPMTGDGLRLAMKSALLAAEETLRVLETGQFATAAERLARARRRAFGAKLVFNRCVRRLVDSPAALQTASAAALVWPAFVCRAVRYAGDAA